MPEFLKGSILLSVIIKFVRAFSNAYNTSVLKGFFDFLGKAFKNSLTHRVLSAYVNKKPWFRYSLTYRFIMLIVKIADKIFGFIYKIFVKCFFGSLILKGVTDLRSMCLTEKCCFAGALLVSIPIGAIAASIVFGSFTYFTMILSWAVFVIGVMVVILGVYGRDSLIIKFAYFVISALKR